MGVHFKVFNQIDIRNLHRNFIVILHLCCFIRAQETGFGSFEEFVADAFIDGQFGDDFLSELLSAKFVFQNYPYAETIGNLEKRSIRDEFNPNPARDFNPDHATFPYGIIPLSERNKSSIAWQPLQGYPPRSPVFIKPFQTDNQTYILKYGHNSIKPLGHQIRYNKKRVRPQPHGPKPLKPLGHQIKNRPEPVYSPNENSNNTKIEAKNANGTYNDLEERNYETHAYAPRGAYPSGYRANITTYERKKLPRFLLPFPFGLYTKDPIRPFPSNSIFTIMPAIIIPFIPFGIWELRVPIAWSVNYLIERFNGIDDGQLTPGRNYQSFSHASRISFLLTDGSSYKGICATWSTFLLPPFVDPEVGHPLCAREDGTG